LVSALPIEEDARLGALDAGDAALVLDRLATLLMYARETEQIAGKLRATGMEDDVRRIPTPPVAIYGNVQSSTDASRGTRGC